MALDWRDEATKLGGGFYFLKRPRGNGMLPTISGQVLTEEGDEVFATETLTEARCWAIGYIRGVQHGHEAGVGEVRRKMCDALGIPRPAQS